MFIGYGKKILAAALLGALPLVSQAALVDYDLRGWGWYVSQPLILEASGLPVTVSADNDRLYQHGILGVGNYGPQGNVLVGDGESLTFDFGNAAVKLAAVTFGGMYSANSAVRVYGDGALLTEFSFVPGAGGYTSDFEPSGWIANTFTFEGVSRGNTGFSIAGLGVTTTTGNLNAVPLPNAVWLFGSAIAFLGMVRRHRLA